MVFLWNTGDYFMSCFYPKQAFYGYGLTRLGKRKIVFNEAEADSSCDFLLPCKKCKACRLENSRQWAMRCCHEASLHSRNSFVTLTYSNKFLPSNGSLDVEVFKRFMKRLRRRFSDDKMLREYPDFYKANGIRFYHCGEYGERFRRPHYHSLLFGCDFPDKYEFYPRGAKPVEGIKYYRSSLLESLWPFGYSMIGDVTFESAAYVARYCMKKVDGQLKDDGYYISKDLKLGVNVDSDTGVISELKPEYATMSRRSAIGKDWYDLFKSDVYPHDFVVFRGRKMRPPKYYDRLYEIEYPDVYEGIKAERTYQAFVRESAEFGHLDSLARSYRKFVKQQIVELNSQRLVRVLDGGI